MRRRLLPSLAAAAPCAITSAAALSTALWFTTLSATVLGAAPLSAAEPLWTNPPARRTAVAIPSVAPLVDRLEPAVLVVFTEAPFAPEDLPPRHPPIGPELPLPPFDGEGPEIRGQGAGFLVTPTGYATSSWTAATPTTRAGRC